MSKLDETIKLLRSAYLEKLESQIPDIQEIIENAIDLEKAIEILGMVHKISGTGGMYGITTISEYASSFEEYLLEIKNNTQPLNEDEIKTKLSELIKRVHMTLSEEIK